MDASHRLIFPGQMTLRATPDLIAGLALILAGLAGTGRAFWVMSSLVSGCPGRGRCASGDRVGNEVEGPLDQPRIEVVTEG